MLKHLVILTAVLAACIAAVMIDRPAPRADLTVIETSDVNTLDPQRMSHNHDFRVAYAIYEGLVRWDTLDEDFGLLPAAAERWDLSSDRTTYTFHLDRGARWSNGDPVRAADFVYSWKRAMLPDTAADYSKLFMLIRGGSRFFEFRSAQLAEYSRRSAERRTPDAAREMLGACDRAFEEMVGLSAPDESTLVVTLEKPVPYFLDLCAFATFLPVHPPTVERSLEIDPSTGMLRQLFGWTKPPRCVGNGPYVLRSWRFKRGLRLEASDTYRGPFAPRSRAIDIKVIENQNTSVLAFKSGAGDLHMNLEVEYIGDMQAEVDRGERRDLHWFTTFGTYFWNFNCTPRLSDGRENPFADAQVRRAFARAVDKQALVEKVRRSREKVADVLVPPGSIPGFRSPAGLSFDVEAARRELESAGWIDRDSDGVPDNASGEQFPLVEMLCTPVGPHRDLAQAMASMWEESLGVRCKIIIKETKVVRNTLDRRDYMIARGGWYGDYLDPLTFLDLHRSGDGNNDRGYSDPAYDAMLERAQAANDSAERTHILEQAERYTMEETLPVLPLYHYDQYYLFRPAGDPSGSGVRHISTHPRLVQYYFHLEREGGGE